MVAIENKVDSGEHSDQLNRYEMAAAAAYPEFKRLHVFLTPAGDRASDEDWVRYSYRRVHDVLARVQRANIGAIGGDVGVFLSHYMNLLETRMMDDAIIAELCRKIYSNHRRAIDLIVEHANVGTVGHLEPVARAVEEMPGKPWVFPNRTGRWFRCIPGAWTDIVPAVAKQIPIASALVFYEVWVDANKCTVVTLNVAPCSDPELRLKLVEHLKSEAATLGIKPNIKVTIDSEWTRLYSTHPYKWSDAPDADELVAKTLKATSDLLSKVDLVTDSLRRFFLKR